MSGAPIRRGRGTFRCGLHSEGAAPAVVSSTNTDRFAFAFEKEAKPIDIVGGGQLDATESARVQIFRRERRKRYIVLVGPLSRLVQICQCKLFGHRGSKPLRLHQKWIRMLHLTIPKHKRLNAIMNQTATQNWTKANLDDATPSPEQTEQTTVEARVEPADGAPEPTEAPPRVRTEVDIMDEISAEDRPAAGSENDDDDEDPSAPTPPFEALLTTDAAERNRLKSFSQNPRACPVLWSRRFSSLSNQLRTELLDLWSLEDITKQRVELHLSFGTLYVCANSQRQETLEDTTFQEMIGKLNDEAVQTHFIEDCPTSISRAVDACCAAAKVVGTRDYSLVKLTFFSQDKQSRSIARALWNGATNSFELTDVESIGVSFKWTILSLDERAAGHNQAAGNNQEGPGKLVAFPVELSFRAFNRNRNVSDHAASQEATIVLEKLTEVEQNMIRHGSSSQHLYEKMDLSSLVSISSDYELESIQIEHIEQRKLANELFVESASCLLIEGFNAAIVRRAREQMLSDDGEKTALPLSFFRTRSNETFWKMRFDGTSSSMNDNLKPLESAFDFARDVLAKANVLNSESRCGAAPEAL